MSVLSLRDLRITYKTQGGGVPAVRGVDLEVATGEVVGLAGESGCGKSTIAGSVLRLLPKSAKIEGEILLDGQDVLSLKPGKLRALRWTGASIIFQGAMHSLNPVRRVGDQIAEAMVVHGQASEKKARVRAGDLLERVNLKPRRIDDYPHELSGGQKQRIMIAMALACNPSLVIADEPTTALDVIVQAQVLRLMKSLQNDLGLSMIFITHDLSVLVEVSDRLAIMYAGKIIEEGPAESVFHDPKHPYTEALAAAFPEIGDTRFRHHPSGLGGDPPDPQRIPPGCSFNPRCAKAFGDCGTHEPALVESGERRRAACLLVGDARSITSGDPVVSVGAPGTVRDELVLGEPVLEVRGLEVNFKARASLFSKRPPDAKAVDGVNLTLHRGEVLALAGESGCGKTTLARAIIGLLVPQAGEVRYQGEPLGRQLKEYRRHVQMVFQDPTAALNPRRTIYEIVAQSLRIHGISRGPNGETEEQLVERALSRAGMRPPNLFFRRYPHELSGGHRQRIVIAGALALDPSVIVADEPVSNLDASVRGEILALLMELRDELQLSVLLVTHDLGLAWTVADRVAVMYLGRIVEIGPAADVLLRPKHPYTKALLDVVPEAGGMNRPILGGEPPDPTQIPPGCRFHVRCPLMGEVPGSGRAAQLGIETACRTQDIAIGEGGTDHLAACHLVSLGELP